MIQDAQLTIVMPVHNRRDIVQRTLDSFAVQTWRPLNIILVDNASTDGTLQVLESWQEAVTNDQFDVTVITEPTPGAAAARNAGLDMVDTPWVMFFDSDDTMAPDHVERAMRQLKRGDTDIVGWDVRLSLLDGTTVRKPFVTHDMLFHCVIDGTFATQRYMCRTELLREAGGWDRTVMVWNDIEMAVRLLCRCPQARVCKVKGQPTVTVYQSEVSITGKTYHGNGKAREHAMDCMNASLPDKYKYIIAIKQTLLAACYAREHHYDDAKRLLARAKGNTTSILRKLALGFAYHYTRLGGRGAARIIKPLF